MKQTLPSAAGPIGIFDSGYGGLTILSKIREALPQYDYIYLGDNARAPYGTRSFEIVYEFTLQAVTKLFEMGSPRHSGMQYSFGKSSAQHTNE